MALFFTPVTVHMNLSEREIRDLAMKVWREREDEVRADADAIPLATLADLLGIDLADPSPTWEAVFGAVEDLVSERR